MMTPLSKGKINEANHIICPWHEYCFDIKTGKEMTGKEIRALKIYPLEYRTDGVYVEIAQKNSEDEFSF